MVMLAAFVFSEPREFAVSFHLGAPRSDNGPMQIRWRDSENVAILMVPSENCQNISAGIGFWFDSESACPRNGAGSNYANSTLEVGKCAGDFSAA